MKRNQILSSSIDREIRNLNNYEQAMLQNLDDRQLQAFARWCDRKEKTQKQSRLKRIACILKRCIIPFE